MWVNFITLWCQRPLSAPNSYRPGPKNFIFRNRTRRWQKMTPEVVLKCCSGPEFFKTPPFLKNRAQHHIILAKNVIFTKQQKCKQKFSKFKFFFLRRIASFWATFYVHAMLITHTQALCSEENKAKNSSPKKWQISKKNFLTPKLSPRRFFIKKG